MFAIGGKADIPFCTANDPLRLEVAAAVAYPDGSMTVSGLRKERDAGRLVVERTAGKEYTTLANIERIRELCRVTPKDRASISNPPEHPEKGSPPSPPSGSSADGSVKRSTGAGKSETAKARKPSPTTSTRGRRRASTSVTQLPSSSQT